MSITPQEVFGVAPKTVLNKPLMHIQDRRAQGIDGGSSIVGWNHRVLNTELVNEISGASLIGDLVSLPAGLYYFEASAMHYDNTTQKGRIEIQDDSGATIIAGLNSRAYSNTSRSPTASGQAELKSSTLVRVGHYTTTAQASSGLGINANISGLEEIYCDLKIWKLDSDVQTVLLTVDSESILSRAMYQVQYRVPNNTTGGDSIAATWVPRPINTEVVNEIAGASLLGNVITLPKGKFEVEVRASTYSVGKSKLAVTVDGTKTILGLTDDSTAEEFHGVLKGRLILPAPADITIQQFTELTTVDGLGHSGNAGDLEDEVYLDVRIYWQDVLVQGTQVAENAILESYQYIGATGVSALVLDCLSYDTFEIEGTNVPMTILLDDMNVGRTIVVSIHNGAAASITWLDSIAWTDGFGPTYTVNLDTIVLTKLGTGVGGAYTLNQT